MTQPISAFLKPKQMRNTSDIFNAEQNRPKVEFKGKRSIGPEIQAPLDRHGRDAHSPRLLRTHLIPT